MKETDLSLENLSLAECLNSRKQYVNHEGSKRKLYARIQVIGREVARLILNRLTPIDKCHGAGLKICRVVHGGGRRLATNDRRGGQLGAHQRFHFMQHLVKAASSIAKPALAFCH